MKRKKVGPSLDELIALGRQHAEGGDLAAAETTYRKALAQAPQHLAVMSLLGMLLVDRGQVDAAIDLLERARELAPDFPPVQLGLGTAYAAAGLDDQAVTALEYVVKLDPTSTLPMERLAKHHLRVGRTREAIGLLRRILRRDPTNAQAPYLLAGLTGDTAGARIDAPPPELIAELFDAYASTFDQHLTEKLHYTVPKALVALLPEPATGTLAVIDLGCGTGLAGVELQPFARSLIGVDLAPRMVMQARQRGIYTAVYCEDLVTTLARVHDADLIVAADVLIYLGALEGTFAACAAALRAGGRFLFSVERGGDADFVLQSNLRYAHSHAYLERLAGAHGFAIERAEAAVLRIDNDQPVHGELLLLRRS